MSTRLRTYSATMNSVNNNQFEVKTVHSKRKIAVPSTNVYLNPALNLLANEDRICNTAMEIVPNKKRKRTRSCGETAAFENPAVDIGISKAAVNEFLAQELENVRKNLRYTDIDTSVSNEFSERVPYHTDSAKRPQVASNMTEDKSNVEICTGNGDMDQNNEVEVSGSQEDIDSGIEQSSVHSVLEQKSSINNDIQTLSPITNISNQVFINNSTNLNLSFIDKLALDSPNMSNRSLYYDDDLNESNIMEIKTITIITKTKRIKNNTNPFLEPNIVTDIPSQNPFLNLDPTKPELEYSEEVLVRPVGVQETAAAVLQPRKLFGDTNSTISTLNESFESQHEYENIDEYRSESPVYENIDDADFNKQSRILGHDVSQFNAVDIMNLNRKSQQDCSYDSNDSKKLKKHFFKVGSKLSKKVYKTLKKTFKGDTVGNNTTLNPYEVPRKPAKAKDQPKDSGIENPALNLDNSDEIEIEEIDDEHEYETIKTMRNTHLNMNITPLRERNDSSDVSHNRTYTPGKKVRFDSTLNQEKVITGNSFDCDIQSPGFDAKLEKYHDELENCINERKFLEQNM